MKKNIYILFACLFLSLQATQVVAQQMSTEDITGDWKLQYNASVAKMGNDLKTHFNGMSATQKSSLKKLYEERVFSFNTNGNYTQTLKDGRSVSGTWSLASNKLTMTDSSGKSLQFTVLSVDNSKLVLKALDDGNTKMLLSEWHLTKN